MNPSAFQTRRDFVNFWVKNIKEGDMVSIDSEAMNFYVVQCNHKDIWVEKTRFHKPPYVTTIPWSRVTNIFQIETHPEMFL